MFHTVETMQGQKNRIILSSIRKTIKRLLILLKNKSKFSILLTTL